MRRISFVFRLLVSANYLPGIHEPQLPVWHTLLNIEIINSVLNRSLNEVQNLPKCVCDPMNRLVMFCCWIPDPECACSKHFGHVYDVMNENFIRKRHGVSECDNEVVTSVCDIMGHTQGHVCNRTSPMNQSLFSQSYVTLLCRTRDVRLLHCT